MHAEMRARNERVVRICDNCIHVHERVTGRNGQRKQYVQYSSLAAVRLVKLVSKKDSLFILASICLFVTQIHGHSATHKAFLKQPVTKNRIDLKLIAP